MKRDSLWSAALFGVFLILPVFLISTNPFDAAVGSWLDIGLLSVAELVGIVGFSLLVVALAMSLSQAGRRRRITQLERENDLTALAMGLLVIFVTLALSVYHPAVAGFYGALALAYALWCLPYSARRIDYRLAVVANCSPEDAFALVSDPRNWNRYLPQLGVQETFDEPLHIGSIVHETWKEGRTVYTEDEVVIAYEPGHRFGTASVGRRPIDGVYEMTPVEGGTEIAWTYSSAFTYAQAVLGGVLRRRGFIARMIERRQKSLDAIKGLLEEPVPAAV